MQNFMMSLKGGWLPPLTLLWKKPCVFSSPWDLFSPAVWRKVFPNNLNCPRWSPPGFISLIHVEFPGLQLQTFTYHYSDTLEKIFFPKGWVKFLEKLPQKLGTRHFFVSGTNFLLLVPTPRYPGDFTHPSEVFRGFFSGVPELLIRKNSRWEWLKKHVFVFEILVRILREGHFLLSRQTNLLPDGISRISGNFFAKPPSGILWKSCLHDDTKCV